MRLHQVSTLSPYLFALVLDILMEQNQEPTPRCMLFVDGSLLEMNDLRLSRSKIEVKVGDHITLHVT